MNPLALFLSPSGRLAQRPFIVAALVVYAVSFASQALVSAPVIMHGGEWPFALAQGVVLWSWYAVHAKRLRDAKSTAGVAGGIAIVFALSVVLFCLVLAFILDLGDSTRTSEEGSGFIVIPWFLLVLLVRIWAGGPELGMLSWTLAGFIIAILIPLGLALGCSLWAATRPSVPD